MEGRRAEAGLGSEIDDAKRLGELLAQPAYRACDLIPAIMPQGHTDNPASHRADKQPIAKFPNQQWGENRNGFGPIEQLHHAQHAIRYWRIHLDDGRASTPGLILCRWWQRQLFQHVTEHHRRKFDDRGKKRGIRAGLENSPHRGHLDGDHERFPCVVGMALVAKAGPFRALRDDAERWPRNDGVRRLLVIRAQQQQPSYCRFPERATGMSFGVGRDGGLDRASFRSSSYPLLQGRRQE